MSNQVEIINQALIKIGANIINDLSEGSIEATLAGQLWSVSRRAVLRSHPWNFAVREQSLAPSIGQSSYNYTYAQQLPANFLRLIKVFDQNDYKIQNGYLFTNYNPTVIKYIYDNTDPNTWDSVFTDVVSSRLAAELSYPLTKSAALMTSMFNIYAAKLQTARYIDASEEASDRIAEFDSPFISVRY